MTENRHYIFIKAEHCYIKIVDVSPLCLGMYYVHDALKLTSLISGPTEKCCVEGQLMSTSSKVILSLPPT